VEEIVTDNGAAFVAALDLLADRYGIMLLPDLLTHWAGQLYIDSGIALNYVSHILFQSRSLCTSLPLDCPYYITPYRPQA
jgi:hypothetical protein